MEALRIVDLDRGGRTEFGFAAFVGDVRVGTILANKLRRKVGGQTVYTVTDVRVDETYRRRGIATKLYEAAAQEACRRRAALASTDRVHGAHSHDFWFKQRQKGRARAVGRKRFPDYVLACDAAHDLSGLRGVQSMNRKSRCDYEIAVREHVQGQMQLRYLDLEAPSFAAAKRALQAHAKSSGARSKDYEIHGICTAKQRPSRGVTHVRASTQEWVCSFTSGSGRLTCKSRQRAAHRAWKRGRK